MARRSKGNTKGLEAIIGLAFLAGFLTLGSPEIQNWIGIISRIAIWSVLVVIVALAGLMVFRIMARMRRGKTLPEIVREIVRRSDQQAPLPGTDGDVADGYERTVPELLDELRSIDWFQFERIVSVVYRKLGYEVTRRGGASPDGGIDLIVEKGGQRRAVQCKHWKTWNVGVRAVREFLGALKDAEIEHGVFVTLGGYTAEARQLAAKHGIELLNETELAMMLKAVDARFDPEIQALLDDTRKLCPKCESEMVLRTASKGMEAGKQFWGCSAYPRCRFTMSE